MIYQAYELKAMLNNLTLAGCNSDGDMEWIGTLQEWDRVNEDVVNGFEQT